MEAFLGDHGAILPAGWYHDRKGEHPMLTVVAERVRFTMKERLADNLHRHLEVTSEYDARIRETVVRMASYVLAMPKERIQIHEAWPEDWWQAFKERWFPGWALKRWPVKYRTIHVDEQKYGPVCPHLDVPGPGRHVEFMLQDGSGEPPVPVPQSFPPLIVDVLLTSDQKFMGIYNVRRADEKPLVVVVNEPASFW
jgi:hypothetical protein